MEGSRNEIHLNTGATFGLRSLMWRSLVSRDLHLLSFPSSWHPCVSRHLMLHTGIRRSSSSVRRRRIATWAWVGKAQRRQAQARRGLNAIRRCRTCGHRNHGWGPRSRSQRDLQAIEQKREVGVRVGGWRKAVDRGAKIEMWKRGEAIRGGLRVKQFINHVLETVLGTELNGCRGRATAHRLTDWHPLPWLLFRTDNLAKTTHQHGKCDTSLSSKGLLVQSVTSHSTQAKS